MTWFLARLGEIIEDFPLTVPVEVDEAHQCISRLSRCEEMQIWSRGHVPLGVWFSVIHAFLQACETCEVPVEAERFCSTLKIACQSWSPIDYSNENRDRPNWSCVRSGDDSKSPCLVTLVALEANQSLVAMWCRIITASQQSCYSVGRGMDMRGWTPSLGDTLCCGRFHTCFHALKRKIYDILVILLSPEFSRIFKTHVLMFFPEGRHFDFGDANQNN